MSIENGKAPYLNNIQQDIAKVGLTPFNESRVHSTQIDIGKLVPIEVIECMPRTTTKIGINSVLLSRNPIVRRLQNGMNLYFHAYFCKKSDLWKAYNNHMTKGRSGTIIKDYPKFYPAMLNTGHIGGSMQGFNDDYTVITPYSPVEYMGVPVIAVSNDGTNIRDGIRQFLPGLATLKVDGVEIAKVNNNFGNVEPANRTKGMRWGINALPLVMYPKIKRAFYQNANLTDKNKYWYPDNEEEFILPYNAGENTLGYVNCLDGSCDFQYDADLLDETSGYYVPSSEKPNKKVRLNCLYSRPFYDDYFTTGNPFKDLMRGDLSQADLNVNLNFTDVFDFEGRTTGDYTKGSEVIAYTYDRSGVHEEDPKIAGFNSSVYSLNGTKRFAEAFNNAKLGGFNLNTLRKAIVMEKMLQRQAKTDGSYKQWILNMFGEMPKIHDGDPIYIGGTYQPIQVSETIGTSGEEFGKNISRAGCSNSGYIGEFYTDDAGYIMIIASIVPDTYYDQQGLDPMWTRSKQEDEYIPILNNLEANEIKNKELFISDDSTWNEQPFAYKPRFAEYKSRRNIVTGLGACGDKAVFDSCTFMKRHFNSKNEVALCNRWLEMTNENVDRTPFTVPNEMPFDIIAGFNIEQIMPMPKEQKPADMGIDY